MALGTMLASAGIPIVSDLIGRIADKIIGKKQDPELMIKLAEVEVRKLEALASLDSVGNVSRTVADIRALLRPFAGLAILATWIGVIFLYNTDMAIVHLVSELAGAVIFYLFGERTVMHLKKLT